MPNVALVALKKHPHGKSYLTPGQSFEAPEREAGILEKLGVARRANVGAHPEQPIAKPTPPPRPSPPVVERPAPEPEPTPLPAAGQPEEPRAAEPMTTKNIVKRGTYKRRDLTAESDE